MQVAATGVHREGEQGAWKISSAAVERKGYLPPREGLPSDGEKFNDRMDASHV
jgi:hypothetical protein